jgi:SET domain-containing protein
MRIIPPSKIYISNSPVHGLGVFASELINKGELIEECPILHLPVKRGETNYVLIDYTFVWPKSEDWNNHVIGLGNASLYNHSNNANAEWESDVQKGTFKFISTKEIKKDEEIFIYYGDENYWDDGRAHIDLI